jgi:general stress protein CsbA
VPWPAGAEEVVMASRADALALWAPRVAGILLCLFLSLFALDAFGGSRTFAQALPDFLIHLTPMLLLLLVVALSWRWEWIGAVVFVGLAVAYAYMARRHPMWVLGISVPLLLVGVLFMASSTHHRRLGHHPVDRG